MASLGIATINVLARTTQFEGSLKRSLGRIGIATAAILAGVGGASFLAGAIKNSVELQRQLAQINTIVSQSEMDQFFSVKQVREFSNEVGVATNAITEATYRAISSGTAAKDAFGVVGKAVKLQLTQPGTELTTVVDALTSALNAYGPKALDAGKASDILFRAAQFGKGTFQDFSHYIATAIPIAQQLGVSFSELAATGAASTRTGKTARVVFTGLKVAMQELSDETKGGGKIFKDAFGESFQSYIARTHDLTGAFAKLAKFVGTKNLTNVFGAKEGAQAIKLLASQAGVLPDILKETANSAGITEESFKKVDATVGRQFDRLKNRLTNFIGSVGDSLSPTVAKVLKAVGDGFDYLMSKGPEIQAALAPTASLIADAWSYLEPVFVAVATAIGAIDWKGLASAATAAITGILYVAAPLYVAATQLTAVFAHDLAPILNTVIGVLNNMKPIIAGIAAAYLAWELAAKLVVAIELVKNAYMVTGAAVTYAYIVATELWTATTNTAALAGGGFAGVLAVIDAVLAANPIGIVVVALVALGAAFIYAWQHSETFRKVVVTTLNAIKDATLQGVKFMLSAFALWVKGQLEGFRLILKGLSYIPKWLGGGAFDTALGAVEDIISGVDAIKNSLDGLISKAQSADLALAQVGNDWNKTAHIPSRGESDAAIAADLKRLGITPAGAAPPKTTTPGIDFGGGGSGGFNPDAAKSAKAAADAIKAALKKVVTDLNRIAKNTSKQTVDAIKGNFETLYADLKEGKVSKQVIKQVQKMEDRLLAMAKKRDSVIAKLTDAKAALKGLTDEAASFTKNIKDTVNELGSVAQATQGVSQTFLGIRNQLRSAIAMTSAFNKNIEQLRTAGLNQTNLQQLIDAGPQAAGDAARILAASGLAGVNQINDLQKQLGGAGDQLAKTGYDALKASGIAMAQGLVTGLQSQQDALLKQMDVLGDRIAARFKKALKISSPSRVFADLGEMIPMGLSKGIDSGIPAVHRSSRNLVDASTHFHSGAVAVNGVADPKAARRAGILAGQGIQSTLDAQKSQREIEGIG